jgi:hypothetical protein
MVSTIGFSKPHETKPKHYPKGKPQKDKETEQKPLTSPQKSISPPKKKPLSPVRKPLSPSQTDKSDGLINHPIRQSPGNGNCFALTSIYAVGQTEAGRKAIKQAIKDNGDGTYSVTLPGDKAHKAYKVTQADLKKGRVNGDIDANILVSAMEKYINDPKNKEDAKKNGHFGVGMMRGGQDPDKMPLTMSSGGNTDYVLNLLGGNHVKSSKGFTGTDSKDKVKDYLIDHASQAGKSSAMTFGATPDVKDGKIKSALSKDGRGGHDFAIQKINLKEQADKGGTVYYVNPWDTSKVYKISVDQLAGIIADSGFAKDHHSFDAIDLSA